MAASDYATRADVEAVRRDLRDTERLLRDRDDEKERGLRMEFVAAVQASEDRTHQRLDDLDEHLNRQDEFLIARRMFWPTWRKQLLLFCLASVIAAIVLHFGFHIG